MFLQLFGDCSFLKEGSALRVLSLPIDRHVVSYKSKDISEKISRFCARLMSRQSKKPE
jgi:hypothetical protein